MPRAIKSVLSPSWKFELAHCRPTFDPIRLDSWTDLPAPNPLPTLYGRGLQPVAWELKFCGPGKGPDFKRVLPIFRGWPASCLTRRAWHMQLWPVDQSGYVHLARQSCMVAPPPAVWDSCVIAAGLQQLRFFFKKKARMTCNIISFIIAHVSFKIYLSTSNWTKNLRFR